MYVCAYKCQWSRQREIVGQVSLLATSVLKEIILFNILISFLDILFLCFAYFWALRMIHRCGEKGTFLTLGMYCLESVVLILLQKYKGALSYLHSSIVACSVPWFLELHF